MNLFVSGRGYLVDPDLWSKLEGRKDVREGEKCNGCGPSASALLSWIIPDKVGGIHVDPACAIHDAQCAKGGTRRDFYLVSQSLGRNVYRCLRYGGASDRFAAFIGARYRFAVHVFGPRAFHFYPNETPPGILLRIEEAWSMSVRDVTPGPSGGTV